MRMVDFRRLVDAAVSDKCGLTTNCLPDYDLYQYWDEDMPVDEAEAAAVDAALDLLAECGFPFDEEDE